MLNTALASADAVQHNSESDPWRAVGMEAGPVTADLKAFRDQILLRRKTIKDTRGCWFGADIVALLVAGEVAPHTIDRISSFVEVGDIQFIDKHHKLRLVCCSRSVSSPVRGKKRRAPASPVISKKHFPVASPSVSRPSFEAALEKDLRKEVQKEMVVTGAKPQWYRGI